MTERIVLLREPVEADGLGNLEGECQVAPRRYEAIYFRRCEKSALHYALAARRLMRLWERRENWLCRSEKPSVEMFRDPARRGFEIAIGLDVAP